MIITEPIQLEKITIAINDLPAHLSGTKIVQLSDLHFDGIRLSVKVLEKAIALCNDIVTQSSTLHQRLRPSSQTLELVARLASNRSRSTVYQSWFEIVFSRTHQLSSRSNRNYS